MMFKLASLNEEKYTSIWGHADTNASNEAPVRSHRLRDNA